LRIIEERERNLSLDDFCAKLSCHPLNCEQDGWIAVIGYQDFVAFIELYRVQNRVAAGRRVLGEDKVAAISAYEASQFFGVGA
jgi:hypothetical protein